MKNSILKKTAAVTAAAILGITSFTAVSSAALIGDADANGMIEAADARLALRASVKLQTLSSSAFSRADVDSDGVVSSADARNILRMSVGLRTPDLNELSFLTSNHYLLKGSVTTYEGTSSVEMAYASGNAYMSAELGGVTIAVAVSGGKTYMIYPAGRVSLEMTSDILSLLDTDVSELISVDDLDFSGYSPDKADKVSTEYVGGKLCTGYTFRTSSGSIRFFVAGNELLRFTRYNSDGAPVEITDVDLITPAVSKDRQGPPAAYKKLSGIEGLGELFELLLEDENFSGLL